MLIVAAVPIAVLVICALHDVQRFKIPNVYVAGLLAAWPIAALLCGLSAGEAISAAGVGGIFLVVGFALFSFRLLGAGDAKLMAALGPWLGVQAVMPFVLYTTLSGAVLAFLLVKFRSRPMPVFAYTHAWLVQMHDRTKVMPYGVAIAIGGIASLSKSPLFS
ncbi:A24 family peptidase [Parvularcula dongshanensis]|uniref:Prepilin peptidase CpaA n=1 Tax=Parvularcula dongshanensis TaxID=1173995 RepID=A0A840HYT6_9PROT|nr:prepilin peptidase [Parvularcula dongshanensis]MBB4657739.1 prepilin peptidase CpaA [Parvularcula dongshanensis]